MIRNYTKIPNELLSASQVPVKARYLMCVMLRYCRQDDYCYPGQNLLASILGCSPRHIRNLITGLESRSLISKKRMGFNKTNTYRVIKDLIIDNRNPASPQLGTKYPLHQGSQFPPNIKYRKRKSNIEGINSLRKTIENIVLKRKIN